MKTKQTRDYRINLGDGSTMIIKSYSSSRARQIAAQMFGASFILKVKQIIDKIS